MGVMLWSNLLVVVALVHLAKARIDLTQRLSGWCANGVSCQSCDEALSVFVVLTRQNMAVCRLRAFVSRVVSISDSRSQRPWEGKGGIIKMATLSFIFHLLA